MTDAIPTVSQLISEAAIEDDEQRWERVVQLFRPGIRAWLQKRRSQLPPQVDQELEAFVDKFFADVKPDFVREFHGSTEEFSAWLTQAMVMRLQRISEQDETVARDTQSVKFPSSETKTFAPSAPAVGAISSERLLALLPQLSDSTRVVAAMRCIEGLKYREIAERTGIEVADAVRLDREAQSQLLRLLESNEYVSGEPMDTVDAPLGQKSRGKT